LYNLSSDDRLRGRLEAQLEPALPLILHHVVHGPGKSCEAEVAALAINLSLTPRNVQIMCAGDGLPLLIARTHRSADPVLAKLLRNCAAADVPCRQTFQRHLHELAGMAVKSPSGDFLVEALGTLANLALPELSYGELVRQHGLADFLAKLMLPSFSDPDTVLEVVMLIGTFASDPKAAALLGSFRTVSLLYEILNARADDADLVLQVTFTLLRLLLTKESREAVLSHERLCVCLLDLVLDPSEEIRSVANSALDVIMEHDVEWRDRVCERRFEVYNREWLHYIANADDAEFQLRYHQDQGGTYGVGGTTPRAGAAEGDEDSYDDAQYGSADLDHRIPMWGERHDMDELDDMSDDESMH